MLLENEGERLIESPTFHPDLLPTNRVLVPLFAVCVRYVICVSGLGLFRLSAPLITKNLFAIKKGST